MRVACPQSMCYYVWLDGAETGNASLAVVRERLASAGLTVGDSPARSPLWSGGKVSPENPVFSRAFEALGPGHDIEASLRIVKDDSLVACFILSPQEGMAAIDLDMWMVLREKYEKALSIIETALAGVAEGRPWSASPSMPSPSLAFRVDVVAGLENEESCIELSKKGVAALGRGTDVLGADVVGNSLLGRMLFVEYRGLRPRPNHGSVSSDSGTEDVASDPERLRGGLSHFGTVSECRTDYIRFNKELMILSLNLAKLRRRDRDSEEIQREIKEKSQQIKSILNSAQRLALDVREPEKESMLWKGGLLKRLGDIESRKVSLAEEVQRLSFLEGKLAEWECDATIEPANVKKWLNEIDFFYMMMEGRSVRGLPDQHEIWLSEHSRLVDRYGEIRERILQIRNKTRNVYDWSRHLYDEAKFELDSARNRLVALATVVAELFIGIDVIIGVYTLEASLSLRLFFIALVLCVLVPIAVFVLRNLAKRPPRPRDPSQPKS